MDHPFWQQAGNFMVVAAGVPALLLPIVYTITFKWWRTLLGRALFFKALGLALLVVLGLLRVVLGEDYPFRTEARFSVFTVVAGGLWFQLYSFMKIRREAREEERRQAVKDYLAGIGYLKGRGRGDRTET